jgi:hypothetical protein
LEWVAIPFLIPFLESFHRFHSEWGEWVLAIPSIPFGMEWNGSESFLEWTEWTLSILGIELESVNSKFPIPESFLEWTEWTWNHSLNGRNGLGMIP